VLFSDLVGSTEISAHLDPEEFRELVADYHRAATEAVTRFGGYVAKYLGDGILAYFGWPEAHDNDAERAGRAGLAIVEAVRELNRRAAVNRPKLSVRVGIDSGTVVVGKGGGSESEVFGDTANIASRVQSAADPDTVVVTPTVNRLVSGLFVVEERGAHQLKGLAEPVDLYRIVRLSSVRNRLAASIVRGLTPFVGRDDETQLLCSRWERASEGEGQVLLIVGEPGIGKSRLVRQFRKQLVSKPHLWIECAGSPYFQNTPFYPIAEMLQLNFARRADDSDATKLSELERALELAGLKLAEAVPLIATMLNLPLGEKYSPLMLSPEQQRKRLMTTLAAWLFGAVQSVVMAVEDLHWFDASSLELMQLLVEQAATARVMLICTARPEFRPPWTTRAHHSQVTLTRLNAREVRELVANVVAENALSEETVDRVVERTGGVPLFVEELTRAVLERGDAKPAAREIPVTLHDSLMARLDRLGPAKEVAQIAAVLGRDFSYELLQAVSPMPEYEMQSALEKLADAELIYTQGIPPEATYQFKHALIQDAAYEALLKSRRRELHRVVASIMTDAFPAVADAQPEVLARHWTYANEAEPAIAAWRKAGDAAFLRYACRETEASFRQALDLIRALPESRERDERELELLNRFVPVLQLTRGWAAPAAAEAIAQAQALAEKTDNLAQLLLQMVGSFVGALSRGDIPATSALGTQVFDLAQREGSPPVLGLARVVKLSACYVQGDLMGGEEHYIAGENLFVTAGERFPSTVGSGFGFGSHIAWLLGRADTARERIRRAVAGATDLGSPFELAYTQHLAAMLQLLLREFASAKVAAAESVALSDEHGFKQYAAGSRLFLGLAEAALGNLRGGMPIVNLGLDGLNESGAGIMMTLYLCWVAIAQSLDGKMPEALATIEKALQTNPEELTWRPDLIRIRGELRRRLGQTDAAEADFRKAITCAQKMSAKAFEMRATTSLVRLLAKQRKRDEARAMLADIYGWFTEGFDTADLKDAKALLDELDI
jgi:class 3 adenylate cyclase/tetratricopeptide (TPR) repeat protein